MQFIRNSKYSTQFLFILLLAVTAMFSISMVNALQLKQSILDERKATVRSAVEIAHQTLVEEASRSARGELDVAAAQQRAIETLNEVRYAGNEYFFIHTTDMVAVMTPNLPDRVGENMGDVKDANGKLIVRAFVDVVSRQQAGFVDYFWPKRGSDTPEPKLSYVKLFEPWGWMLGTGLYLDDIDAAFYERLFTSMAILVVFTLLMIALVVLMLRNARDRTTDIVAQLNKMASAEQTASMQIDEDIPDNEMGLILRSLANAQNRMLQRMTARHEDTKRIKEALDLASSPVLLTDADARIQYANQSARQLFASLKPTFQAHFPRFEDGDLLSLSLDQLHTNPGQAADQITQLSSTTTEELVLGDTYLKVVKTPVMGETESDQLLGIVVEWEDLTELHAHEREIQDESQAEREKAQDVKRRVDEVLEIVGAASKGDLSREISISGDDEVGLMAASLKGFLDTLRGNLATINGHAGSMTDTAALLASTSNGLNDNTKVTSAQASTASASAENISAAVESVASASEQMSSSIKVIAGNTTQAADIAQKAVKLASSTDTSVRQLAESSGRIGQVINISEIGDTVDEINTIQSTIATSVEEQMSTSLSISRSVQTAAEDCSEVAQNVSNAAEAASNARVAAQQSGTAVEGLSTMASELQELVRYYKIS